MLSVTCLARWLCYWETARQLHCITTLPVAKIMYRQTYLNEKWVRNTDEKIMLSLAFKSMNNSKKNTWNTDILNVSSYVLQNTHRKFSPYFSNKSALDPNPITTSIFREGWHVTDYYVQIISSFWPHWACRTSCVNVESESWHREGRRVIERHN